MVEFSFVSGLASGVSYRIETKGIIYEVEAGIEVLPPIHSRTEMGSDGSIDYYLTEWEDWMGRKYQTWRMRTHGGTIQSASGFSEDLGTIESHF